MHGANRLGANSLLDIVVSVCYILMHMLHRSKGTNHTSLSSTLTSAVHANVCVLLFLHSFLLLLIRRCSAARWRCASLRSPSPVRGWQLHLFVSPILPSSSIALFRWPSYLFLCVASVMWLCAVCAGQTQPELPKDAGMASIANLDKLR